MALLEFFNNLDKYIIIVSFTKVVRQHIYEQGQDKIKKKLQVTSAHIGCLCKVRCGCISKEIYENPKLINCLGSKKRH
jgi:hypothetical protein